MSATPRYIAAIDQGTTSTRCLLFDHSGAPRSIAQKEHRQICPRPGWVEHDAEEIWNNCRQVITQALKETHVSPEQIAAVGITNQRETIVAWDRRTGRPFGNAIVWQDTRTEGLCRRFSQSIGNEPIRKATGLPLTTYFSAPKIRWLLENNPAFRESASRGEAAVGTMDSWLLWNLTGKHHTDVTNASRTQLMNLRGCHWDSEMLAAFDIPESLLPEIQPSSSLHGFGKTLETGPFGRALPVTGVIGDQQGALVGQACFREGEAKNTYGTGCFLLMNTGPTPIDSRHGLLGTLAYQFGSEPATYALEGSIAVAGSLIQWLRDQLGILTSSSEVEALASSVPDSGGVILVPAFSGLFAPYWRDDARGAILGLTHFAGKAHIARAALEATAYQVQAALEAMQQDAGTHLKSLRVDGGMVVNRLLMQFQADILGAEVIRPKVLESTALGAAYCAGVATGFWKDLEEVRAHWQEDCRWAPSMDPKVRDELLARWSDAVKRTFKWPETGAGSEGAA